MSKSYTAKEAATAVLRKAEEMLRKAEAKAKDAGSADGKIEKAAEKTLADEDGTKIDKGEGKEKGKLPPGGKKDPNDLLEGLTGLKNPRPEDKPKASSKERPLKKFMSSVIHKRSSRK